MNDKIDSNKKKDIQDFTHGPRIIVLDESDFDGSWAESEEGKRKLAELKEYMAKFNFELEETENNPDLFNWWYVEEE